VAYRIIVADPSPSVQKTVQLAFPEPEFRLFPFEAGADLLESIAGIRPDAILLSLSLPGRDAFEVGRLLRSREELRRVPLVFLRGTFEALDLSRIAAADCDGIFLKPFDSERLAATIRELIEKKTWPLTLPEEPVIPKERPAGNGRGTKGAA
jgi:CheY-like chemotaxis protein